MPAASPGACSHRCTGPAACAAVRLSPEIEIRTGRAHERGRTAQDAGIAAAAARSRWQRPKPRLQTQAASSASAGLPPKRLNLTLIGSGWCWVLIRICAPSVGALQRCVLAKSPRAAVHQMAAPLQPDAARRRRRLRHLHRVPSHCVGSLQLTGTRVVPATLQQMQLTRRPRCAAVEILP
jgi:hypothetical protein